VARFSDRQKTKVHVVGVAALVERAGAPPKRAPRLAEGDKHGYAMREDIRTFADVKLGPGTLYGAITRLERRGFIDR
jgi:hypothetical protein